MDYLKENVRPVSKKRIIIIDKNREVSLFASLLNTMCSRRDIWIGNIQYWTKYLVRERFENSAQIIGVNYKRIFV